MQVAKLAGPFVLLQVLPRGLQISWLPLFDVPMLRFHRTREFGQRDEMRLLRWGFDEAFDQQLKLPVDLPHPNSEDARVDEVSQDQKLRDEMCEWD